MRLFIAIPLEDKIKTLISNICKQIRIENLNPKWVKGENCHITLKFLGEVEKERIGKIIGACKEIASKHKPFVISFGNIGAFPSQNYPRVIFLGIEKGCDTLADIANSLEGELFKIGFEKEKRPFTPHLTLTRIKYSQKTTALSFFLSKKFIPNEMDVKEIMLIESRLTPKGSIYTQISSFPL